MLNNIKRSGLSVKKKNKHTISTLGEGEKVRSFRIVCGCNKFAAYLAYEFAFTAGLTIFYHICAIQSIVSFLLCNRALL